MTTSPGTLEKEVLAAYEQYLEAFMADDMETINSLISFPLAHIGEGTVMLLDTFPLRPADLMAQTGWHDTRDMQYDVVGITPTKAHVVLRAGTRVRKDGSPIEDILAFYAWTRTAEGWKMFAISGISLPAAA